MTQMFTNFFFLHFFKIRENQSNQCSTIFSVYFVYFVVNILVSLRLLYTSINNLLVFHLDNLVSDAIISVIVTHHNDCFALLS